MKKATERIAARLRALAAMASTDRGLGGRMRVLAARRTSVVALVAAAVVGAAAASARGSSGDLAAWWSFDEGSGNKVADSSGNHNDGNVVGATFVAGQAGSALSFTGTDSYVQVPNSSSLEPANVSVEAWVKRSGSPGQYKYIVSKGAEACTAASYGLYSGPDGGLMFYISNGVLFTRSPDAGVGVWDGSWHRAVGTFDGSTVRMYLDGLEVGSGNPTSLSIQYGLPDTNDLSIGAYRGSCSWDDFDGLIDGVKIYGRALTAAEVQDATPPVITPSVSGTLGLNGWYTTDVTVSWSVSDPETGIASSSGCGTTTVSTDGTSTITCSATNGVGLSSSSTVTVKRDGTSPVVTCNTPAPSFLLNQADARVYATVTDATSGPQSSPVYAVANTSSPGAGSVSVTGYDLAGLSTTVSCPFNTLYDFSGFYQPVDNPPTLNSVKAGSSIPVKFSLHGYQGLSIFADGYPKSQLIACDSAVASDDIEQTVTAGGSSLSYDTTADQYVYVWKTDKAWAGTCRQLVVKLRDGVSHVANFRFK